MLMPGRQYNSNSYRFGYNQGSEKDDEIAGVTGAHFNTFFREGDTRTGRWWSVDPKASAFESPYVSMGDNPIVNNDARGDTLRFVFQYDPRKGGMMKQYTEFVAFTEAFNKSYAYLKKHNAADIIDKLQAAPQDIYVKQSSGGNSFSDIIKDPNYRSIMWNPERGLLTSKGYRLSPAELFSHEADHALAFVSNFLKLKKEKYSPTPSYENDEERRVIQGSEQNVAKKLGKLKFGEVTRDNHDGSSKVINGIKDPTDNYSNLLREIVVTPNK